MFLAWFLFFYFFLFLIIKVQRNKINYMKGTIYVYY
nr:MAG TPA: hypothetical protein [Caudoviricetes sp.]